MDNKFSGKVIKGLQVGAKFGIATANIEVIRNMPDITEGVYYVQVQRILDRDLVNGILHIGELKTFGREKTCEVHLLGFDEEIYEEVLEIEVLKFVRPTKKFQNADMLYTQIERDVLGAEKYFLRQKIYQGWRGLGKDEKKALSDQALDEISGNQDFLSAKNIFIYAPQEDREIDFTEALMANFSEKNYFFPKVMGEGEMSFFQVEDYSDLGAGKYGILEPQNPPKPPLKKGAKMNTPDLVFVPSVAMDEAGNRLGKGGGFYDRWLSTFAETPQTIGILPSFSIVEKVPVEGHDQKVGMVIKV